VKFIDEVFTDPFLTERVAPQERPLKPDDYSELIEKVLEELGLEYEESADYFQLQNPFSEKDNRKSAQWWRQSGMFRSYNCSIEVTRKGQVVVDTSLTLTEVVRLLGLFNLYINFILDSGHIKQSELLEYKEALVEYHFFKGKSAVIDRLRPLFFNNYILDSDVLPFQTKASDFKFTKFHAKDKPAETKHEIKLLECPEFFKLKCKKYMDSRKLEYSDSVYPIMYKSSRMPYAIPSICIEYPNGFKKLRLLEGSTRYLTHTADGKYGLLYPVRQSGSKRCVLVEGEFEAIVLAKYIEDDVFALHNTNSLPSTVQIQDYDEVVVRIDYDKFNENKRMLEQTLKKTMPLAKVLVEPKIKLLTSEGKKQYDYNDLHAKGVLGEFLEYGESILEGI
jgi:hypothetical protein